MMLRDVPVLREKLPRTIHKEGSTKTKKPKQKGKKPKDTLTLQIFTIEGSMTTSLKTIRSFSQKNHSLMFQSKEVNQEDSRNLGSALVLKRLMSLAK